MTPRGQVMGEFEHLVALALLRLGEGAYGVAIRKEIARVAGRPVILGAVYAALSRMERKGWVSSTISEPEPRPGGRSKKLVALTPAGREALRQARGMIARMSEGLDLDEGLEVQ
ncbi:MAG TPA: PadR family transcriptional regulator [Longimicrobiales bacterium]|jgi:DNA-binding PadR family transcriptional regulator|nr:PadR family transcriptional regulator [Longimicrobiales bacterium]